MPTKLLRLLLPLLLLFGGAASAFAQQVRCTVRDSAGEALIGACVQVAGARNYGITDLDGLAVLDNVPANAVLTITLFGYQTAEVSVGGRSAIDVTLTL